jgi:hypothetical protein
VDIYDYLRLPGIHARVSGVAAENIWARPNSRKQLSGKAEGGGVPNMESEGRKARKSQSGKPNLP